MRNLVLILCMCFFLCACASSQRGGKRSNDADLKESPCAGCFGPEEFKKLDRKPDYVG